MIFTFKGYNTYIFNLDSKGKALLFNDGNLDLGDPSSPDCLGVIRLDDNRIIVDVNDKNDQSVGDRWEKSYVIGNEDIVCFGNNELFVHLNYNTSGKIIGGQFILKRDDVMNEVQAGSDSSETTPTYPDSMSISSLQKFSSETKISKADGMEEEASKRLAVEVSSMSSTLDKNAKGSSENGHLDSDNNSDREKLDRIARETSVIEKTIFKADNDDEVDAPDTIRESDSPNASSGSDSGSGGQKRESLDQIARNTAIIETTYLTEVFEPNVPTSSTSLKTEHLLQIGEGFKEDPLTGICEYQVRKFIGKGGFGEVYKIEDRQGNPFALKVLNPDIIRGRENIYALFDNEVSIGRYLEFPALVRTLESGFDVPHQLRYCVMAFVDGVNFAHVVAYLTKQQKRLHYLYATWIVLKVAEVLEFLSANGIVHRDIKMQNVMVNRRGEIKVMDLGIARQRNDNSPLRPNEPLGTLSYLPMGQLYRKDPVDTRLDIYCLGVMYYRMLTNKAPLPEPPIRCDSRIRHYREVTRDIYKNPSMTPNPKKIVRRIPAYVAAIVMKMMAQDINNRYVDVKELIGDLSNVVDTNDNSEKIANELGKLSMSVVHLKPYTPPAYLPPRKKHMRRSLWIILLTAILLFSVLYVFNYIDDFNRNETNFHNLVNTKRTQDVIKSLKDLEDDLDMLETGGGVNPVSWSKEQWQKWLCCKSKERNIKQFLMKFENLSRKANDVVWFLKKFYWVEETPKLWSLDEQKRFDAIQKRMRTISEKIKTQGATNEMATGQVLSRRTMSVMSENGSRQKHNDENNNDQKNDIAQQVAVTLDERQALARKELEDLSVTVNVDDAPSELLEDKRFGQDVEWMMTTFGKLKISLRKVQVRELEKQLEVRRRAKNLDVSKFSKVATADFQRRFNEYTAAKNGWEVGANDRKFSEELVSELQKGLVNPNVTVEDVNYQNYSGPILASILSRRIDKADEIARELLKLGADADVCFLKNEFLSSSDFTYVKALPVVLAEGGVDKMAGFILPVLSAQDFYKSVWRNRNLTSEDLVARLIVLKHNLVERNRQGNTALHYAAKIGSSRLVALMLLEGADVNAINEAGETPLHLVLKYGHLQLEPLLLQQGANTTFKTVKGETIEDCRKVGLFFQNIEKKNYSAVINALENGMSPDLFGSNDVTILQMACRNNDVELVKILLKFNANIDLAGSGGYPLNLTPISWAFDAQSLDIVEMLIEKGANPNICPPGYGGSYYLLDKLCDSSYMYRGDKEKEMRWFKALLNAKMPLKLVNWAGPTINNAFRNKVDIECVSLLLERYESFPDGSNVIATALFNEYPDSIVERLVDKKADINILFTIPNYTITRNGGTSTKLLRAGQKTMALWLAVEQNRPKIVELLLKNGADVNWKDENGKTVKDLPCSDKIRRMLEKQQGNDTKAGKVKKEKTGIETSNKTSKNKRRDETSVDGMDYKTITLPDGVKMKLVKIEPGSFKILKTNKKITLTREYWLGETEVTQGQYKAIMKGVTDESGNAIKLRPSEFSGDDRLPVDRISPDEAKAACERLNVLYEGKLPHGYQFNLPTEAQWEFAARGGNKSKGYKYSGGNDIDLIAWYSGNSENKTHPVGTKRANELGLYDMSGNVWEWCRDVFEKDFTKDIEYLSILQQSSRKVYRGGSWCSDFGCRPTARHIQLPFDAIWGRGFRMALVPIDSNTSVSFDNSNETESGTVKDEKKVTKLFNKTAENRMKDVSIGEGRRYKILILPGGVELKLLKIEHGSFTMGSVNGKSVEYKRAVILTKDYWLGETEVTQGQYAVIMDGVINEVGRRCNSRPSYFIGDNRPVEQVSWYDAKAFCKKLNSLFEGTLPDGYHFDLPTEAQWEFAARGGNKSKGYEYSGSNRLEEVGWSGGNSEYMTHPVGQKGKNELGLYDMSGNVWEWCRDVQENERDYAKDPEFLRGQPTNCSWRVRRGGSWGGHGNCWYRYWDADNSLFWFCDLGFRVALVPIDVNTSASLGDVNKADMAEKACTEEVAYVNEVRVDGAEFGKWTHDWDAAIATAKKEGKPIFVNFTGSDWCGWCKLLKSKVFSQNEWISWANNNVYLVHIDFPTDQKLVPGKYRERNRELARRYNVGGYPTCFLLDHATLKPLGKFGASRDITAAAFINKVEAAMPSEKGAERK